MIKSNKIHVTLILILALIILSFGYIFYYKNKSVDVAVVGVVQSVPAGSIIKTESISNQGAPEASTTTTPYVASVETTIEYPQFGNLSSSTKFLEAKSALNMKLKNDAEVLYKKGTDELNQTLDSLEGSHKDEPVSFKYSLIDDQKIYSEKNYINDDTGIFSYATKSYTDMAGAHGTFFYTSESYDLSSGNKIGLSDVLQGAYKPFLLQYVKEKIASKSPDCLHCENLSSLSDTESQYVTFDNFVLLKEGITFLFGAYDLGAYAETASGDELFVPKSALTGFIKKDW